MKKIILLAAVSGFALSAFAEDVSNQNYYVQFNTGASFGQKPKGDFKKDDLSTSAIYEAAFGYKFDENFRADVSLGYRPGYENKYSDSVVDKGDTYNDHSKVEVKSYSAMLNLYYDIANISGFTPYVTSGFGVTKNKTNNNTVSSFDELGQLTSYVYDKGSKTNFAWKVGLGSKYQISQSFDLDLRYQYADFGKFQTSGTYYIDGVKNSGSAKKGSLKAHEVLVGVAYKF